MTTLPVAPWRSRPELLWLVEALTRDGGAARFVGGAVRDTVLGLPVSDVDLATPLLPDAVIARVEAAGMKAVPTGISHGTVTVVSGGQPFEVTTLRRDLATDGRHATIAYSDDWEEDAARRDFTINALYADPASGAIFDWFGGLADLESGTVRFIGDPAQRIAEDHLRILRFYRFAARFGRGVLNAESVAAVVTARHSLRTLSRERVADEWLKILGLADPLAIVAHMATDGVLVEIMPEADAGALERLARLIANELGVAAEPDAVRRVAALLPAPDTAASFAHRLRFSNRMRERLVCLATHRASGLDQPARHLAYRIGTNAARDCWLLAGDPQGVGSALQSLHDWHPPRFPVKGGQIVARGIDAGPTVARTLKMIEEMWIAADFPEGDALAALVDQALAAAARQ